jgi:hypothetical protein
MEKMRKTLFTCLAGSLGALLIVCSLGGCAATSVPIEPQETVSVHYLDDGSTLRVEDTLFEGGPDEGLSLLEKIKKVSEELNVSSEKNALLARELAAMRGNREKLEEDLSQAKEQMIALNGEIAALKVTLTERDAQLDQTDREKRDLMEKLINLKIEKAKVEKELLKIKIAALSGEG